MGGARQFRVRIILLSLHGLDLVAETSCAAALFSFCFAADWRSRCTAQLGSRFDLAYYSQRSRRLALHLLRIRLGLQEQGDVGLQLLRHERRLNDLPDALDDRVQPLPPCAPVET